MKSGKWILTVITILFIAAMITLTFTARSIREARLPHVTAGRLTRESFTIHHESGGMTTYRQIAIPKHMLESDIFIVVSHTVNGEERDFAQKVYVVTGMEIGDLYEVTGGLSGHELVIFDSSKPLHDGDEVFVRD